MVELPVFGQCAAYEKLTVSSTSKALTVAKYFRYNDHANQSARVAFITVDGTAGTNDIRYTLDGTAPVATTTGHLFKAGSSEPLIIKGLGNITNLRMIREGTDAVVQISYFI